MFILNERREIIIIVYVYTFPNGKRYVGQTINSLDQRARKGKGYRKGLPIYNAIQEYGWDNIQKEIFECETEEETDALEQELIALYKTQDRNFGYNLDSGGNLNKHRSEETKKKISESIKGEKHPLYGKHLSDEWKQHLSESKSGENHWNYGKTLSEETKNKIKISRGTPVICLETKEIYPSTGLAGDAVGRSGKTIYCAITGRQKTAGGFHWMWLEDYENQK